MNSLYLAHPYEWMAHHGIPGMKWGKRRFQNKDGSLTEAGKRRYAKYARRHIRSKEGDAKGFLREGASKALSPQERVRLKGSYHKLVNYTGDADNASAKIKTLADKRTKEKFDEEISNNPELYKGPFKSGARDKLRSRLYEESIESIRGENPDLVSRINAATDAAQAWKNVCREATDTLVGKYGNRRVRVLSSETVGDALSKTLERIVIEEWYD